MLLHKYGSMAAKSFSLPSACAQRRSSSERSERIPHGGPGNKRGFEVVELRLSSLHSSSVFRLASTILLILAVDAEPAASILRCKSDQPSSTKPWTVNPEPRIPDLKPPGPIAQASFRPFGCKFSFPGRARNARGQGPCGCQAPYPPEHGTLQCLLVPI